MQQFDDARRRHSSALTLSRTTGDRYEHARALDGLVDALRAAGSPNDADRRQQEAITIYRRLGVPEADHSK
jgi:hypothetical protein